jgi:hypothetical protein
MERTVLRQMFVDLVKQQLVCQEDALLLQLLLYSRIDAFAVPTQMLFVAAAGATGGAGGGRQPRPCFAYEPTGHMFAFGEHDDDNAEGGGMLPVVSDGRGGYGVDVSAIEAGFDLLYKQLNKLTDEVAQAAAAAEAGKALAAADAKVLLNKLRVAIADVKTDLGKQRGAVRTTLGSGRSGRQSYGRGGGGGRGRGGGRASLFW